MRGYQAMSGCGFCSNFSTTGGACWTGTASVFALEPCDLIQVSYADLPHLFRRLVRALLHALSKVFEAAIKTRRSLYNLRILRDTTLGVQVIAVKEIIPDNVIVIPRADFVIKDSDILLVMGDEKNLKKVNSL